MRGWDFFDNRKLAAILLLFCIIHSFTVRARSILGELMILRAMDLTQPQGDDHIHRFAAAPFTRHIRVRTDGNSEVPFFNGSAFDYRYIHPYGHIGVVTALGFESVHYDNLGKRFKRSRFGIDDIGIGLHFDIIRYDRERLSISGLIGLATAAANPMGTLVGAGHHQFGVNVKAGFGILEAYDLRFFGEAQILQSLKETVLLNKKMELLRAQPCEKPFFRETFDVGTIFSNILALRSGPDEEGFEIGYHGTIIFNVQRDIEPLSYEGFTKASMKSCIDKHKNMEKLTLHKDDHKATYVHHIYAQYNCVFLTDWYPVGFALGSAYSFGTDSWRGFLAWASVSVHF